MISLPALPTRLARQMLGDAARGAISSLFVEGDEPGERTSLLADTSPDPGLFGPDSVTWRVHADLAMFIGGLRALFVQTLHPLAMAGVAEHSKYREDPLGRLSRTGAYIAMTTFGTTAEAERAIAEVRAVHARVRGTASDGRHYAALDPGLLAWVHHVEVDSFLTAYQRFGAGILSAAEADCYVSEMAGIGERVGVIEPARSVGELRSWLDGVEGLRATAEAHSAVRFLLLPPLPVRVLPAYGVIASAAVGLMSWRQRLELRIPPLPVTDRVLVQPAARTMLGTMRFALGESPTLAAARARCAA